MGGIEGESELLEHEEHGHDHKEKPDQVIPLERLFEIDHGKYRENDECDHFLDGLELGTGKFAVAYAVGRDLETIFKKSNHPADKDRQPQGRTPVL